ncbi:MAG: DUF1015 domain-containing protein [Dehalococcoidia bacterium]
MAEVRPFRALRYDPAVADPSRTIAPPYDVISPALQTELYDRDAHNIIRIEYGREQSGDSEAANRYTRAAAELRDWRSKGVLALDPEPAIYVYRQRFEWNSTRYERTAYFGAVRLEEWEAGVVKPHEHTLSHPKADRMNLIRATQAQVSPVYSVFRPRKSDGLWFEHPEHAEIAIDGGGERHLIDRVTDEIAIADFARLIEESDVYIADGHHRYETALAYRDEVRGRSAPWTGDEPENFVLMALTRHSDPGLLVLPTHRLVHLPSLPDDALSRIAARFDTHRVDTADADTLILSLEEAKQETAAFVVAGLPEGAYLLTLRDRGAIEAMMPGDQPHAWKRLDVNVLQYGILQDVFGIDDARLKAGASVSYTQDEREALRSVAAGEAQLAFLLNATPVEQVLAVADAGGRMPQKSTYFHPKLPTGLVVSSLT